MKLATRDEASECDLQLILLLISWILSWSLLLLAPFFHDVLSLLWEMLVLLPVLFINSAVFKFALEHRTPQN